MKHLAISLAMMLVTSFSSAQAKEQRGADLDALIKQLESEDARERAAACYELGKLHEKAEPAAMKVATLLAKDEDVNVRKMAAQTLGEIAVHTQGDPGENPKVLMGVLIDALGHPKAGVRLMAAESIGNFRKNADPATLALARLATSDGDPRVRHAAIQSLGNIGHFGGPQSEKALPYLQKALSDPDPEIRRLTVYVLSRFGEASRPMIPKLIDTLRDGPPPAQVEAARTLAGHGPAAIAAVPVLFDKLHQRRHLSLRSAAAEAIIRIDPTQWDKVATILIEATRSEDSGIRMFALDALLTTVRKREHFTKYVVPTLERLRTDDIVEIQLRAAEELETIEPQ